MKIFYDPTTEGFYHQGVQINIPKTAIEITSNQYNNFREFQSLGKLVKYDGQGFYTEDRESSVEDLIMIEKFWVSSELFRAGEQLNLVQDSDPAAVGTVTSWRDYRKQLRAWENNEKFPNKEFRPEAPDYKE